MTNNNKQGVGMVPCYIKAGEIARLAMRVPDKRVRGGIYSGDRATEDPLAWWCLTELIVDYAENTRTETHDDAR